jgi:hypothetical protein
MSPVHDSSSFAPILMLPHRTCLHSGCSVLAVCISCRVIAVFVFRKPLFINQTLPYLRMLHKYHVMYSFWYYLQFHITEVGLGMYYPQIRGHTRTQKSHTKLLQQKEVNLRLVSYCTNQLDRAFVRVFPPQLISRWSMNTFVSTKISYCVVKAADLTCC